MLTLYILLLEDQGDRLLFTQFYERYEKKLYRVALSILHSQALAEEALHEAMVSIALHFNQFKKIYQNACQEIEPWCVTIVKNRALTILRKECRSTGLDENWDTPAPEHVEGERAYHRLVALIRAMPETYRRALELRFVCEYTNREIAKSLGISEAAAGARISRGRAMLIERLRQEGYDRETV